MKLIDTFFCLLYRIGMELYLYDEKESKFLAIAFMLAWSEMVVYDCYVFFFEFYGLSDLRREIPISGVSIPLFLLFGVIWGVRYYKCKKNITQEFDARYKTWHPDTRELCRILTFVIFLVPIIVLYIIYKFMVNG